MLASGDTVETILEEPLELEPEDIQHVSHFPATPLSASLSTDVFREVI